MIDITILEPNEIDPTVRQRIEEAHGPGAFDDVDFIVYWRKYRDSEAGGFTWSGWPFAGLGLTMRRYDDPENWKTTYFIFSHA